MLHWFKKDRYPEFTILRASLLKGQYFYRTAYFHWTDKQQQHICAMPPGQSKMTTMDDWPQVVFLDALGQLTIAQYTLKLARRFPRREVNSDFDKNILYQIEQLREIDCVALSGQPVRLTREFATPTSEWWSPNTDASPPTV